MPEHGAVAHLRGDGKARIGQALEVALDGPLCDA